MVVGEVVGVVVGVVVGEVVGEEEGLCVGEEEGVCVGFYSRSYFVKVDKLVGCVRARGASRTEFDRLPRHESLVA